MTTVLLYYDTKRSPLCHQCFPLSHFQLMACLVASIRSSGASHGTIKLVDTSSIVNAKLSGNQKHSIKFHFVFTMARKSTLTCAEFHFFQQVIPHVFEIVTQEVQCQPMGSVNYLSADKLSTTKSWHVYGGL